MGKTEVASSAAEDDGGSPTMRTAETLLRVLPMALCLAALVIMLKDTQTNEFGTLSYSDLGAFRYLVHASGVCAGYSLLSAVFAAVPRPSTLSRAWAFFLLDQLLTYIILAAGAVSTEVVYLAYKGDKSVTWSESCGSYGGFCRKATASIALTFIVTLCYAGLSLLSSYRLFSKYDAPVAYSTTKGIEAATCNA
ncbi:CASP-like protein 2A1 [Salvia hispanica]|uniref:CASP-like protein 2A1 n=1 Tax=Salvia hispanica TaxID=49212 RepID=UPI0020097983|nr:CASP-like protein 2A1 [Salvia hispanica]